MNETRQSNEAVKVFYSYSHKDEKLRDTLEDHLALLKRQKVISEWHDRGIGAGREWVGEINEHLKSADIILLLVSASFIASDYCYDVELKLAMERHEAGAAHVVPVILQPCDWTTASFGKLQALPKNARPVTKWRNRAEAFTDIANGIRRVAEELSENRREAAAPAAAVENARLPDASRHAASLIPRPPVVGFVARRDDQGRDIVALLKRELAPDKSGLIALWGVGGTGKTTLAAEVARPLRDDYKQRLAWVSALGRVDFGLQMLLDEIATQLGRADIRRSAPDLKAEQVRALLAEAPSLVVLDNFETIEPDEQSRCVNFLAESTECSALITTRERVNHADVRNVKLAAMALDDAREFWRRMVEQSARPSAFDGLDADEIVRHCEANPLVIQWVVGQIELAQRPKDALAYLSQGQGDAAERVFDRSFNLPQLGDDGRAALLALSLFTPDASREALAEVAGFGDDLNRLNEAVRKMSALWLVETTEGNKRLFLRALKYEMAKSRLSKDAHADDFRRRYIGHFLRYAEAHAEPRPENIDALDTEKGNLRGAADAAFGMRDWESVMLIGAALDKFLYLRGYWDEAIGLGELAEAAARESDDEGRKASFAIGVATVRRNRGEKEEAKRIYVEALEVFIRLKRDIDRAICLDRLGKIAQTQGRTEEARSLYRESLSISETCDSKMGVARTLNNLGKLAQDQKDYEEALRCYGESLEISRRLTDHQGIAITLRRLGLIAKSKGELDEARRLYEESLEMSKSLVDQHGIAITLRSIAQLEKDEGHNKAAVRLFREALSIYERLGSPSGKKVRDYLVTLEGSSD